MRKILLCLILLSTESCSKSEENPLPSTPTIIEGTVSNGSNTQLNRPISVSLKGIRLNGFNPSTQTLNTTAIVDDMGKYKIATVIPKKTNVLFINLEGITSNDSVRIIVNTKSFHYRGFSDDVNTPTSEIKTGTSNEVNFKIFTK